MIKYILKRLLFFIPTLILISVISFLLSKMAPGDPVLSYLELDGEEEILDASNDVFKMNYKKVYKSLHLDKPSFYFTILPSNYPDLKPAIIDGRFQNLYGAYLDQHLNHEETFLYISELMKLESDIKDKEYVNYLISFQSFLEESSTREGKVKLENLLNKLEDLTLSNEYKDQLLFLYDKMISSYNWFIYPCFNWNGFDNQYQFWISSFVSKEPIRSYKDGISVLVKLRKSLKWTIFMVIPALVISFILAILIGVYTSKFPNNYWTKFINGFNYFMFSIPLFWLATMALIFSAQYWGFLSWGSYIKQDDSLWNHLSKFILPVIVIVLHNVAYISRQMNAAMRKQARMDYIKTAIGKGLGEKDVTWKHQFRNALLPIITMMTAALPGSLSGSVVLELIFNIPGMGRLMYHSIFQLDWPVVLGALMCLSLISLVFMLVGDILYAWINPKIRFHAD